MYRPWTQQARRSWSSTIRTPSTEAYPSRTDIALASEPQAHYVLVSTAESGASDGPVSVRSYRIVDGSVTEEEIDVTE